ncbi:hypothetical protein T484DRAFT_1786769 [Baffinella frigidus]|nr:hypothetical protein T484DRAFT_1786769 [Cryptophyta sp. CCMP2293]
MPQHLVSAQGVEFDPQEDNTRVLRAVICAGLYPNVVRVQKPETTYVEQVAGAIAQAPTAKQLKMYTQAPTAKQLKMFTQVC